MPVPGLSALTFRILILNHAQTSFAPQLGQNLEPLTFAPLDRDLIDPSVLTPHTRKLLNDYHRSVLEKISPYLNEEEKLWLSGECAEI